MAAGISSRFVPLSSEYPKGLLEVKGEILIERQIRQLLEAGVNDITLVVGYKAEMFNYLKDKYGVSIILNDDYARYNNTSSLIRVIDKLDNTFVCSSDNYFLENVFTTLSEESYYSALYAKGETDEYCLITNKYNDIIEVSVGGRDSWYMVGHVYFNHNFSSQFREIMKKEYVHDYTKLGYWEDVYIRHINELPKMKINRYQDNEIQEFDSLDELRLFDNSYVSDTRSSVIKTICQRLEVHESDVSCFKNIKHKGDYLYFIFSIGTQSYEYNDKNDIVIEKL